MYTGDWISSVLSLPVRPYGDGNWNTNIAHEIVTGRKGAIVVYWSVHTVNFPSHCYLHLHWLDYFLSSLLFFPMFS